MRPRGHDAAGVFVGVRSTALLLAMVAVSACAGAAPVTGAASPRLAGAEPELRPIVASRLAGELQALGLDPRDLPPLEQLDRERLREVMELLSRATGAKCVDCHAKGDFATPTRRKRIAARMWDEFVVKLAFADGSPLFCDSCHQGRFILLGRGEFQGDALKAFKKGPLSRFMDDNFVQKLKRKDGQDHDCETCHVDWNMTFLSDWAKAR